MEPATAWPTCEMLATLVLAGSCTSQAWAATTFAVENCDMSESSRVCRARGEIVFGEMNLAASADTPSSRTSASLVCLRSLGESSENGTHFRASLTHPTGDRSPTGIGSRVCRARGESVFGEM